MVHGRKVVEIQNELRTRGYPEETLRHCALDTIDPDGNMPLQGLLPDLGSLREEELTKLWIIVDEDDRVAT